MVRARLQTQAIQSVPDCLYRPAIIKIVTPFSQVKISLHAYTSTVCVQIKWRLIYKFGWNVFNLTFILKDSHLCACCVLYTLLLKRGFLWNVSCLRKKSYVQTLRALIISRGTCLSLIRDKREGMKGNWKMRNWSEHLDIGRNNYSPITFHYNHRQCVTNKTYNGSHKGGFKSPPDLNFPALLLLLLKKFLHSTAQRTTLINRIISFMSNITSLENKVLYSLHQYGNY